MAVLVNTLLTNKLGVDGFFRISICWKFDWLPTNFVFFEVILTTKLQQQTFNKDKKQIFLSLIFFKLLKFVQFLFVLFWVLVWVGFESATLNCQYSGTHQIKLITTEITKVFTSLILKQLFLMRNHHCFKLNQK